MSNQNVSLAPPGTRIAPRQNLQIVDRGISILAGSVVGVLAGRRRGTVSLLMGLAGSMLLARGLAGMSPVKRLLGQKPDELAVAKGAGWTRAAVLSRSVTINAPREAVFKRFRDVARWHEWAVNVESIDAGAEGQLHIITRDPAGVSEWDAEITEEKVGALLEIGSALEADVPAKMRFEFRDAPGGRGTEIHGVISYEPPGGSLSRYAAKMTEREPGIQLRRDLKRFKSLIETGEIAVNAPQDTEPKA